jgi:adenylylsulfate kinase
MFAEQEITVLVGLICSLESIRQLVQSIVPDRMQIFVDAPISVCEDRDPKGLYKQAPEGALLGFTGVDSDFEPPPAPDLVCHTDRETIAESASKILALLQEPSYFPAGARQTMDGRRRTIAVDFDNVIANYEGGVARRTLDILGLMLETYYAL